MRLLTFRFDDGFWLGTQKAIEILHPHQGSFFIVGDRVLGLARLDDNPSLAGTDFGSAAGWKALAEAGQDIQPHGYSHRRFSDLTLSEVKDEFRKSIDIIRRISAGPYIFCCPFNDLPPLLDFAALGLSALGFETRTSREPVLVNNLGALEPFRLRSWAVRESDLNYVESQLTSVPDASWTVLAMHSLDGEGHEPWSAKGLADLVSLVAALGFEIVTAKAIIRRVEAASLETASNSEALVEASKEPQ